MSPKDVVRRTTGGVMRVDVGNLQTLDLDTIEHEEAPALIARGAAYAREYARIEDKPALLAVNLATVLLALRKRHGDLRGGSWEYRQDAQAVYDQANIRDQEQLRRLKGNVRYHMGNLLRRTLTPREIDRLELIDASPLERQQDKRATNTALIRAATVAADVAASTPKTVNASTGKQEAVPTQGGGAGTGVKATADHLRLAGVALGLVVQLDTGVIDDHMTNGQRAKLDEQLAEMEKNLRRLRRHLKSRRSEA